VTGDLKRFFAGDPTAGAFMSGFFPVRMFGLPAACLAMYHTALPERRRAVGGLLGSIALTSLLTGVTEPIEFTFMFLAPFLYVVHALLTGVAFVIMNALHVRLGFGFSAGLFDYVLNFNRATHPWLLWPVGVLYFGLYYGLFRVAIVKLNLKTPGRDVTETAASAVAVPSVAGGRAAGYIAALGGAGNLVSVDACTTRLRLNVASRDAVDTNALKALGARGFVRPSATSLQVVIGANADQIAGEIRDALREGTPWAAAHASSDTVLSLSGATATATDVMPASFKTSAPDSATMSASFKAAAPDSATIQLLLAALGGRTNVRSVDVAASRLRINVAKASAIDAHAIRSLGLRGVTVPSPECVHVIVGPAAGVTSESLRRLIA
jgi:PTS system N-acetylglucosamine-specific IIC component